MDDEGTVITDDEGNPVYEVVKLRKALLADEWSGEPMRDSAGAFITEEVEQINFGYRTNGKNTKDTLDVMVSDYKLGVPLFLTALFPGDMAEITDYDRTFWGEVVKKTSYNLGSNIWINEVRN